MEICLSQFWTNLGISNISVDIEFHGIQWYLI